MQKPRLARDIMVTKLLTLPPHLHVFDGIALLLKRNVSGAPVIDRDWNYLGVFSEKCSLSVLTATANTARENGELFRKPSLAQDFMRKKLVTLTQDMDVIEAIGLLLKYRISGAPVIDNQRTCLGVFSEKSSMRVLLDAAYDQIPTSEVGKYMDQDTARDVPPDLDVLAVARLFLDKHYRRLEVVQDGKLLGQISRRDVLRAQHHLASTLKNREEMLQESSAQVTVSDHHNETMNGDPLPNLDVATFMDRDAMTVEEDTDLLTLAQIFLETNFRRLPVVEEGKLVGQVSRRDVLQATHQLMEIPSATESALLYLSALVDRNDAPIA